MSNTDTSVSWWEVFTEAEGLKKLGNPFRFGKEGD